MTVFGAVAKIPRKMALPADNWKTLGLNALLLSAAAALTYLTQNITGTDLGNYTGLVVGLMTIALGYINKVIQNDVSNPDPIPLPDPIVPQPLPIPVNPDNGGNDFPLN